MISKFYSRLLAIVDHFSFHTQCWKFEEEMAEASKELAKMQGQEDCIAVRQRFVEELADMYIVGSQLLIALDSRFPGMVGHQSYQELFFETINKKLDRTELRIKDGYYERKEDKEDGCVTA